MASANPDMVLTPVHSKQKAQVEDRLVETEPPEDLSELDDAVSGLTSVPVSPTKSAIARHSSKAGWVDKIVELVGFSKKAVSGEPQDLQTVEHGREVERNQTINESPIREGRILPTLEPSIPIARLAMAKSTALKSPSRAPGSPANLGKRKHIPRQDLYEVEASPQDSEPENRANKRPRQNIKAKPPLTNPKTSKGYASSHHIRLMRGSNVPGAGEMQTTVDVPLSSPVSGEKSTNPIEGEQAKRTAKRGRGRPRKLPYQEPVRDGDVATSKKGPTNRAISNPQAPREVEEGISNVLMVPSPVTVVREENLPAAAAGKQRKVAKPRDQGIEIVNGVTSVEDEEYDDVEEGQDVSDETEVGAGQEAANSSSSEPRKSPIDQELLKRLRDRARHVGQKFNTEKQNWSKQKTETLRTIPGKNMNRQLKAMIAGYKKLQSSKIAGDKRAYQDAHKDIEKVFSLLRLEADDVLLSIFGTGSDTKNAEAMLTDLYFHILPRIILAVQKAAQVYENEGLMETPDLQKISDIVQLLYDLASSAVKQPKEIQPKPSSKKSTYQISQPTRSNLPDIRNLQKIISFELRSRERAKKLAEEERLRPERERRRREKKEREEAELRRRKEERRRMQGKDWWDLQNNYFPHPWNRILQVNLANLEAKPSTWRQAAAAGKGKGRQESVELEHADAHSAESRHRGDQGVERVSMFPHNNINEVSRLKSLTNEDMSIFIDCMRYEQAEDRFERAAEQLGRSMDEVFALARDFQDAMDFQHEQGNYNEARDEWTYSVWVENNRQVFV